VSTAGHPNRVGRGQAIRSASTDPVTEALSARRRNWWPGQAKKLARAADTRIFSSHPQSPTPSAFSMPSPRQRSLPLRRY